MGLPHLDETVQPDDRVTDTNSARDFSTTSATQRWRVNVLYVSDCETQARHFDAGKLLDSSSMPSSMRQG